MLSLRIAIRYFFSRGSHSVVNLISAVCVLSIAAPVAATILVLSLHGGLMNYVASMYRDFDPPIRITDSGNHFFTPDSATLRYLQHSDQVATISASIEQEVLLGYRGENQYVATLRGVDSNYRHVVPISQRLTHGQYTLRKGVLDQLVVGQGIAYNMGINPSMKTPLTIYSLSPPTPLPIPLPIPLYTTAQATPTAIYAMDEATDSRYLFSDLEFAQSLFGKQGKISALNLAVRGVTPETLKATLEKHLPPHYTVATTHEQRSSLFQIMGIERWVIYALLVMITAIAALSLTGAIVMMTTEKQTQNRALLQMGLPQRTLRNVYRDLGLLITTLGMTLGVILGLTLALIQQHYEILQMGGTTMLLNAYPITLNPYDILLTIASTLALGVTISTLTTRSLNINR